MKILWAKTDFLHPTDRGGQIRTLEMLRRLHTRHEVHYVCFGSSDDSIGLSGAKQYCSHVYPVPHRVPDKTSPAFLPQLIGGLVSSRPVAVSRFASARMRERIAALCKQHRFDVVVADFLFVAPNMPDLASCVLFQHNVESVIWQRRVQNAGDPLRKAYLKLQADRMFRYEKDVCRTVRRVIAVSEVDSDTMRRLYGVQDVPFVPTGVDIDFFAPPPSSEPKADLVFVGSMDWMPNADGAAWFASEVLPLIRRHRPECTVAIVGRKPAASLLELGKSDPRIVVTGTVPDVRPWLFGSAVSVVPLRIGGGTRLKIYEAMAAQVPVVSTSIGAEGLRVDDGRNIRIADSPQDFAARCLELLENPSERARIAAAASATLAEHCTWDAVTRDFEQLLVQ